MLRKAVLYPIALAAALVLLAPPALAADQGFTTPRYFGLKLDDKPLNGAASTLTIEVTLTDSGAAGGNAAYSKLLVGILYTYSAATAVTMTWECSLDGTNYAQKTSGVVSSGVRALSAFSDSWTTSAADANFMPELDVRGCRKVRLVLAGTSADASDLVDVYVTAVAGN